MIGTEAAIFDVDGVLLPSPHERALREALDGLADAGRFTTAMYQTFVARKPRLVGARAALEQLGVADADAKASIYADRKQGRLEAFHLGFRVQWRGRTLRVRIEQVRRRVLATLEDGDPMTVIVGGASSPPCPRTGARHRLELPKSRRPGGHCLQPTVMSTAERDAEDLPTHPGTPDGTLGRTHDTVRASLDSNIVTRRHPAFYWYLFAVLLSCILLAFDYALGPTTLGLDPSYVPIINHLLLAILLSSLILSSQRLVGVFLSKKTVDDNITFFNLKLVIRLVATILVCLIFLSAISQTWYTVPVALGMFSIVTGFALQTPMTSFVGWIYILFRKPYRVGDRVKIGGATGDVIDVSYFDTTLWEFGGQYLSTDHPSGRIIKFPNSIVLNAPVYNYSWELFPYIWDEIRFYVAYNSDLDFVTSVMLTEAKDEVGAVMAERVRAYRSILDRTPVDQLDVREEPTVFFRTNEDGWLDAVVRYLVDPKEAGRVKTVLLRRMLAKLNAEPDRTLFPKWR